MVPGSRGQCKTDVMLVVISTLGLVTTCGQCDARRVSRVIRGTDANPTRDQTSTIQAVSIRGFTPLFTVSHPCIPGVLLVYPGDWIEYPLCRHVLAPV